MESVHPMPMPHSSIHLTSFRPSSLGIALGAFTGLFHLIWAILVWAGAAQPLIDFIFRLHMIEPPYHIAPFSTTEALGLVTFTACTGYVSGWFLGWLWKFYSRHSE